jgi:hypothetical protein
MDETDIYAKFHRLKESTNHSPGRSHSRPPALTVPPPVTIARVKPLIYIGLS